MAEPIGEVGYLSGICGHDGTNWEKILIDASKRLVIAVAAFSAAVEVLQDTPGDLLVGCHQYTGSAWVKSNLLFGYNDRWVFIDDETSDGSAETTVSSDIVPDGYVYVCTGLGCYHNDTAARIVNVALDVAGSQYYFCGLGSVTQNQWTADVVNVVLKKDDKLTLHITGLANGKAVYFRGVGYMMKIDM